MDEKVFLKNESLSVSNSRFIVNGQTYAINNVTSVKSSTKKAEHAGEFLFIVMGLSALLFGSGWVQLVGIFIIIAGVIFWLKNKTKYAVVLNTSAGESEALVSTDKAYIEDVILALNNAIVSRG